MEHTVLETLHSCPFCGGQDFSPALSVVDHTVSKETFLLVECSSCNGRFTSPRPDQQSIGAYYRSEDYISHTNTAHTVQDKLYQLARKWALGRKHRILAKYRSQGRVLDIGCGTGEFLGYLKGRGYLVQGVEPDLGAREQAIANHALEVVPGLEIVPSNEQFNVVTMWHVLEHVPDPRRTLKKIYSIMADRGILVIAVPDRESWDASHYRAEWAAYDVPRHLFHFRRADLHRLLHEHGFVLLKTGPMWMDAPYIALLSERYRGRGSFLAMVMGTLLGLWSNVIALIGRRPASSSLFIAQKQEP